MAKFSFDEAAKVLKRLHVQFRQDYEYRGDCPNRARYNLPFFTSVRLPLSPLEWCAICMRDGCHYVGGCCSAESAVQDIMNSIFRDSGWTTINEIAEIADTSIHHDDLDATGVPNFKHLGLLIDVVELWGQFDPWHKIAVVWHLTKDNYVPKAPEASRGNSDGVEEAMTVLEGGLRHLNIHRLFERMDQHSEAAGIDEEVRKQLEHNRLQSASQGQTSKLLALYRILPALKTFTEKVNELNPGPLEGFALVHKELAGDVVAKNGHGYCVYANKKDANEIMELWRKDDAERKDERGSNWKPIDERIVVRKVRVSVEKGIEFLD